MFKRNEIQTGEIEVMEEYLQKKRDRFHLQVASRSSFSSYNNIVSELNVTSFVITTARTDHKKKGRFFIERKTVIFKSILETCFIHYAETPTQMDRDHSLSLMFLSPSGVQLLCR